MTLFFADFCKVKCCIYIGGSYTADFFCGFTAQNIT